MKKFLIIIILIFCVFLCGCIKEEKTSLDEIKERGNLVVGVKFDAKPFGYIENGELQGFDIDIAKKLQKKFLMTKVRLSLLKLILKTGYQNL